MIVRRAKSAGFCAGVRRALSIARREAKRHGILYVLGDLIHNETVLQELAREGIRCAKTPESIPAGAAVLLRAHGTPPAVIRACHDRGLSVLDATCPMVSDIHRLAKKLTADGYRLTVIGDPGHPEVEAIAGQVDGAVILSDPDAGLERLPAVWRRIGVVVQSTQRADHIEAFRLRLAATGREIAFHNTICAPTRSHQEEVRRLAGTCDAVVIVGSKRSANTRRLGKIAAEYNPRTIVVERPEDLRPAFFSGVSSVGLSAGASTPEETIAAVEARLKAMK